MGFEGDPFTLDSFFHPNANTNLVMDEGVFQGSCSRFTGFSRLLFACQELFKEFECAFTLQNRNENLVRLRKGFIFVTVKVPDE